MENKQTAVEWLVDELLDGKLLMPSLIEQVKAMEMEQIMKAYGQGIADEAGEILDATKDAQQYYNETYKSE